MAPPKAALAAGKMFNAAEGGVWRQEVYRSRRILAALAAGKIFNAAEGGIRRQKIYRSCRKVDVRIPITLWEPIKAPMGRQRWVPLKIFNTTENCFGHQKMSL